MNAHSTITISDMDPEALEELRITREFDIQERTGVAGWFMAQSLHRKANLASALSLGGLVLVTLAGVAGYFFQSLGGAMAIVQAALALSVLIGGYLSLAFIHREVIAPFNRIAHELGRLAEGARDIDVWGIDRPDDFGDMARALAVFVKSGHKLDELFATRKKAEEDKRRRDEEERARIEGERRATIERLARDLESGVGDVVGTVAAAASQLQSTASSLAASARQTSTQVGLVSDGMEQANSGATAAAAASDEFAMSIGEISRQAATSASLAREASEAASSADATIGALSDSASQVGQIVELIQSIAKRTNLLALNASIEAARGGEAGRGFAVVASEVKELANQTSRATEDVAQQIRAMQDSTGASVEALRSIGTQIKSLETTAISIASAVDQQSVAGQDLARSIDVAARSTDSVSSHLAQVREASDTNGEAASQVLSSANALEAQAGSLQGKVQAFLAGVRAG